MTNERLKIANEKQAKQIAKLKTGKKPFKRLKNYLLALVAMLPPVLNVTLDLGLSEGNLIIFMIPTLLLMYLGKNAN